MAADSLWQVHAAIEKANKDRPQRVYVAHSAGEGAEIDRKDTLEGGAWSFKAPVRYEVYRNPCRGWSQYGTTTEEAKARALADEAGKTGTRVLIVAVY